VTTGARSSASGTSVDVQNSRMKNFCSPARAPGGTTMACGQPGGTPATCRSGRGAMLKPAAPDLDSGSHIQAGEDPFEHRVSAGERR